MVRLALLNGFVGFPSAPILSYPLLAPVSTEGVAKGAEQIVLLPDVSAFLGAQSHLRSFGHVSDFFELQPAHEEKSDFVLPSGGGLDLLAAGLGTLAVGFLFYFLTRRKDAVRTPPEWPANEEVLGATKTAFLQEWEEYDRLAPVVRAYQSLEQAHERGGVPLPHPAMFDFSEFGWHSPDFLSLLERTDLAERKHLRIGEFGAGLGKPHELRHFAQEHGALVQALADCNGDMEETRRRVLDSNGGVAAQIAEAVLKRLQSQITSGKERLFLRPGEMAEAIADATGLRLPDYEPRHYKLLRRVAEEVYGPSGGTAFEPRELLLLFLAGNRSGELHVFDQNAELKSDLKRRDLTVLKLWGNKYWTNTNDDIAEGRDAYLERLISSRPITKTLFSDDKSPASIEAVRILLADRELQKIRLHDADILGKPLPRTEPFDLSVFLQAFYFCPPLTGLLAWADIVSRTKVGGYLLSDIDFHPDYFQDVMDEMGLSLVHVTADNPYHSGRSSSLYRRVRETEAIRRLASLRVS